jgi:hypothetical protein
MKDLNIPINRISENGLLIHPQSLRKYFKMMHSFYYNRKDLSLLEGFQHRNPFNVKVCTVEPDGEFISIPFDEG